MQKFSSASLHGVRSSRVLSRSSAKLNVRGFSDILDTASQFLRAPVDYFKKEDPNEAQIKELLSAAKRGRMDIAFKIAEPLASTNETPAQCVARECSAHASRSWVDVRDERRKVVEQAISGATFYLPLRGAIRIEDLPTHFWSKKCKKHHDLSDEVIKLCRASVALRGLESEDAVQSLDKQCLVGDAVALRQAEHVGRAFQIMSQAITTRLQTSRSCSVLHAFVAKAFMDDPNLPVRCPTLFRLMLKAGSHLTSELTNPELPGPLDDIESAQGDATRRYLCSTLQERVAKRQSASLKHMSMISEITAEAALSLSSDPKEGLALVTAAEVFFQEECPLAERRKAMKIFQLTRERLSDRI